MDGFLRLNPHCRLLMGAKRACLYNVVDGEMLSLHDTETQFLTATQGQRPISRLLIEFPATDRAKLVDFVEQLERRELGRMYDQPYYVMPLQRGPSGSLATFFEPLRVSALSLEVTQDCNLNCAFCGDYGRHSRGTGCGRYDDQSGASLTLADRLRILAQARDLGISELRLFGGEPLLSDEWQTLAGAAVACGVERVVLWTNGLLPLPERWLREGRQLRLTTQIFSCVEDVHDRVAGRQGAFGALVANLRSWQAQDLDPQLVLVVTRLGEEHYKETHAFFQQFSRLPVIVRPLYSFGFSALAPLRCPDLLSVKRWFLRVDARLLGVLDRCHSCFRGQLAVAADGRIMPCIASRGWAFGDARTESLQQILIEGRHEPFWSLPKARLKKCSSCEFRLGCFDCRVIQGNGHSLEEVYHCDYDPASGAWAPADVDRVPEAREVLGG